MYEPFAYVEGISGLTSPGGSLVNLSHSYGEIGGGGGGGGGRAKKTHAI